MMITNIDHFGVPRKHHVQQIVDWKKYVHHQKPPPHERSKCRESAFAFGNLLEIHAQIAKPTNNPTLSKAPVYGRSGRAPISAIYREILAELRAKKLTGSNYSFCTKTIAHNTLKLFIYKIRYCNFRQVFQDCTDNLKPVLVGLPVWRQSVGFAAIENLGVT